MSDRSDQLPIQRPASDPVSSSVTSNPVLRRMTEEILEKSRQTTLRRARYRLGEYELCEPDYQLISLWAKDLDMAPAALLALLAQSWIYHSGEPWYVEPISFVLEDGAIRSLVWDFDRLPRFPDLWVEGLHLHTLGFVWDRRTPNTTLSPKVPGLRRLCMVPSSDRFRLKQVRKLELSGVPHLARLECIGFGHTKLDLSPVPNLTELWCGDNQLTELDLSPVPNLTELWCSDNQLTELDLSPVPKLTWLSCDKGVIVRNAPPGLKIVRKG